MTLTTQQQSAVTMIVHAVLDTIRESGPMGAPSGILYAGLMAQGCSLSQYQSLMGALERAGKVRLDGDCYHAC